MILSSGPNSAPNSVPQLRVQSHALPRPITCPPTSSHMSSASRHISLASRHMFPGVPSHVLSRPITECVAVAHEGLVAVAPSRVSGRRPSDVGGRRPSEVSEWVGA